LEIRVDKMRRIISLSLYLLVYRLCFLILCHLSIPPL
jgi:hypothetical protein